jgi:hypothetical protein
MRINSQHDNNLLAHNTVLWLACMLSVIFSCYFWSSLTATLPMKALYAVSGLLFDLVKIMALPIAIYSWRRSCYTKSAISGVMYLLLSLVSIFAGISVVQNNVIQQHKQSTEYASVQQQLVDTIELKKKTIRSLQLLADNEQNTGYKTRAKNTLLEVAKQELALINIHRDLQQKSNNIIESVPGYADSNSKTRNALLFIILGGLLETTTGFLLYISSSRNVPKVQAHKVVPKGYIVPEVQMYLNVPAINDGSNNVPKNVPLGTSQNLGTVKSLENKGKTQVQSQVQIVPKCTYASRQVRSQVKDEVQSIGTKITDETVKKQIKNKIWKPTVRTIKENASVGTEHARRILRQLTKDGSLYKQNGRYRLRNIQHEVE